MDLKTRLIGVVSAFALVASASATTTKIKAFTRYGDGVCLNPSVDGMAIIKFDSTIAGSTVHVHMQDLQASEPGGLQYTYGVAIIGTVSGDFDYSEPSLFTTNASGNGSVDIDLPTIDLGAAPIVYIYYWDGLSDFSTIVGFDPHQFRAVGTVTP